MAASARSRPTIFGRQPSGPPLPWAWADDQLREARTYWVATVGRSTAPRVRPYWGCWTGNAFQFSTMSPALRAIRANPQASVHLESGSDVVVVEGHAEVVLASDRLRRFVDDYNRKYAWDLEVRGRLVADSEGASGNVVRVRASVVYAWRQSLETATKWRFPTAS